MGKVPHGQLAITGTGINKLLDEFPNLSHLIGVDISYLELTLSAFNRRVIVVLFCIPISTF